MSQPLNKLAPFVVHGVNGEVILQVNQQGVQVLNIIFPDGSVLTSAGVSTSPINSEDVDCGTF